MRFALRVILAFFWLGAGARAAGPVEIEVNDGKVMINQANVVTTDIVCSNGVIHVIDAVIMPPKKTQKEKAHADK